MRKRADPRKRDTARPEPQPSPAWEIAARLLSGIAPPELKRVAAGALASLIRGRKSGPGFDEFGMDPAFMEWLRPFFEFLYYAYFRVEAEGVKNLPAEGPAILVANHSGALPYDGVMINLAVFNEHAKHRNVRFLVEDFVFATPLLRDFISRAGGVRACHENATKLIDRGELIVVFPEGTKGVGKSFDERYRLRRFGRGGFVKLAMRTGAPVVPVAVVGAEEIHPIIWKSEALARPFGLPFIPFTPTFPWLGPLGLVPLPTKWRIVFGKPIRFAHFKPRDAENEALVQDHAERIKNSIQSTIDSILKKRRSIWN